MAEKDKKLPAMQYYPGDWRKDLAVQSLDFFDRGVWHEMLMVLHDSERRGVFVLNGHAMNDEQIGRSIGLDNHRVIQCITTLLTSGVASREPETGALYSRRMVRDEQIRKIRANNGKLGGNPNLVKNSDNHLDNQKPTTLDNQKPTPSSSSSPSGKKQVPTRTSSAAVLQRKAEGSGPGHETPKSAKIHNPKNSHGAIAGAPDVPEVASTRSERATVPPKFIASDVKSGEVSPKKRPEVDPRFGPFREEIFKFWKGANEVAIREGRMSKECPWGPRERSEMARWLATNPGASLPMLQTYLVNRATTEGIVLSDPPYLWLKVLLSYAYGPLDRYKKRPRSRPR